MNNVNTSSFCLYTYPSYQRFSSIRLGHFKVIHSSKPYDPVCNVLRYGNLPRRPHPQSWGVERTNAATCRNIYIYFYFYFFIFFYINFI